jgi:hypothetical protein
MTVNRRQLAKVLEMLGSAHDGEVLAAARRADALVKTSGEDWAALLGVKTPMGSVLDLQATSRAPENHARRRSREITSFEMLMALLQSDRTPAEVKKSLRPLEPRLLDGDIGDGELADLRALFSRYVSSATAT